MNSRERFQKAMLRQAVDRPPYDLDGTPMTKIISPKVIAELHALLGLPAPVQADGYADECLLEALDIDFRRVGARPIPEGGLVRIISPTQRIDEWGIEHRYVHDEWQITGNPLKGASIDDLKSYPWPQANNVDRKKIARWKERARRLYEETDRVVVAEHPVLGVFELGCWLCGFEDFLMRLALEPEFVDALFQIVYAYQCDMIDLYYSELGPYIHVTTSGDDFGTQRGPFLSLQMFDELVAPYYDKRIRLTKNYTSALYFHHTCGSVYRLLPRIIAAGVDILNPVQPNAADMEPEKLHREFGSQIAFWGAIDTQQILPAGTPEQVRAHVREVVQAFDAYHGGYVLAPAHTLQRDVPARNVAAIFQALA